MSSNAEELNSQTEELKAAVKATLNDNRQRHQEKIENHYSPRFH